MSSFYNYRFRTNQIAHRQMTREDVWRVAWEFFCQDNTAIMDLYCFVEECTAIHEVPHFMFVENKSLANAIQKSKFQAEQVHLPQGITFISWPKGFKIGKHAANGVMVTNGDLTTRTIWHKRYFKAIDVTPPPYSFVEMDTNGYFSFTFISPIDPLQHLKLNIPYEKISHFMAATTTDEMINIIQGEFFGNELEREEMDYQLGIGQATLKALVYAQAMPDKVKAGVPDKRAMPPKQHHTGVTIKAPDALKGLANPTSVGFFFRQLKHKKYYQNEHQQKTLGTRWVFVQPHERGMRAETINE